MAKREMTEEQKIEQAKKRAETIRGKKEAREAGRLFFGRFSVFYDGEDNWIVERDMDPRERRYFPNLTYCLHHVLHEKIGEKLAEGAKTAMEAIKQAEKSVMDVVLGSEKRIAEFTGKLSL